MLFPLCLTYTLILQHLSLTIPSLSRPPSSSLFIFLHLSLALSLPHSPLSHPILSLFISFHLSRVILPCTYTTYFAIVMLRSRYIPQLHASPLVCLYVCFVS